ncbi:hypothetical protein H8959_016176, partial [Pygathrix nigripes]
MRTASLSPRAPAQSRTNAARAARAGATPAQSAAVRLRGRSCDGLRAGGEGPRVSCEDWAVVHLQGRGCRTGRFRSPRGRRPSAARRVRGFCPAKHTRQVSCAAAYLTCR